MSHEEMQAVLIGLSAVFGFVLLVFGFVWVYDRRRDRRERREVREHFEKRGLL